ncbi:MAG: tRNA (adenosine(37)-N6)-threonylcarbamoyltransferase complex dimerization subunit type 1 TsaB [Saprospiraceae bacterium]
MAKILLIETSGEVCSAGISVDGNLVALSENLEAKNHAAELTLQIEACSKEAGIPIAQLDAVALSRGPGSYTALRVGASVAKGICYALDKPLIAVDTLLTLAFASRVEGNDTGFGDVNSTFGAQGPRPDTQPSSDLFVPLLDARRQEVWVAIYDNDLREIVPAQPLILENNSFEKFVFEKTGDALTKRLVLAGNGMKKIRSGEFPKNTVFSRINKCSAKFMAVAAEQLFQKFDFQDIVYFEPFYMKPPNITTPGKPLF